MVRQASSLKNFETIRNCKKWPDQPTTYLLTYRAAGMYKDMRTGPHHVFRIEGGKPEFYLS